MKPNFALFITTLLVAFLIQLNYFQSFTLLDNDKWVQRIENLSNDILQTPIHIEFKDNNGIFRYGSHPGTSIILPAAIAYRLGANAQTSLIVTLASLNAVLIAIATLVCFKLRPKSLWFILVSIILTIHPLYFYSTPTNAIIAPTIALLHLLTLSVFENRNKPNLLSYITLFAIIAGFGLATRIPTTVFIATPLLTFASIYIKIKKTLLVIAIAAFIGTILNPFLWLIPIEYITTIISRAAMHVTNTGALGTIYTPSNFILYSPITLIALIFIGTLLFLPSYKPPLSRLFILTLLLITGTNFAILVGSKFKSLRYLYPMIFTWDIFFPLFILHATKYFDFSFLKSPQKQSTARTITKITLSIIIILGFYYLAFYNLVFPSTQGKI